MSHIRRNQVLAAAAIGLACIRVSLASIIFDVQVSSVSGVGLFVQDAHHVSVTATGGTINFDVYADVTNGGAPSASDGFLMARGYLVAGLPTGSGNVSGNNGPSGNLTNGVMIAPFNGNNSVGPPGSGAFLTSTAVVDLNGNTFTDYGDISTSTTLTIIPRASVTALNSSNGGSSNFKFFSFSMPVISLRLGTTSISFTNTATGIAIQWQESGVVKTLTSGTVGAFIPAIVSIGETPITFIGLSSIPSFSPTTPANLNLASNNGVGTIITPTSFGSIGLLSDVPNPGPLEVLLHADKLQTLLTDTNFEGGTAINLTAGGLDVDATALAASHPWANLLVRYPTTTDAGNAFLNFNLDGTVNQLAVVPEPASLALLAIGTFALLTHRRIQIIRR